MEFIEQIFHEQNKVFVSLLEDQGFTAVQANGFLSEVSKKLSMNNPDLNSPHAIKILISQDPAKLLDLIDIKPFAQNLGIASIVAELGIKTIQADLSYFMSQKKDDLLNTIVSLSWGSYGKPTPFSKHAYN